jgi:hypothetical protein
MSLLLCTPPPVGVSPSCASVAKQVVTSVISSLANVLQSPSVGSAKNPFMSLFVTTRHLMCCTSGHSFVGKGVQSSRRSTGGEGGGGRVGGDAGGGGAEGGLQKSGRKTVRQWYCKWGGIGSAAHLSWV